MSTSKRPLHGTNNEFGAKDDNLTMPWCLILFNDFNQILSEPLNLANQRQENIPENLQNEMLYREVKRYKGLLSKVINLS